MSRTDHARKPFVGRKYRTWGFYDGMGNFIDWREYHGIVDHAERQAVRS